MRRQPADVARSIEPRGQTRPVLEIGLEGGPRQRYQLPALRLGGAAAGRGGGGRALRVLAVAGVGYLIGSVSFSGSIVDYGTNVEGTDPGFHDLATQDFSLDPGGPCENAGGPLNTAALPTHQPTSQYARHQRASLRLGDAPDLGALESGLLFADGFEAGGPVNWSTTQP